MYMLIFIMVLSSGLSVERVGVFKTMDDCVAAKKALSKGTQKRTEVAKSTAYVCFALTKEGE